MLISIFNTNVSILNQYKNIIKPYNIIHWLIWYKMQLFKRAQDNLTKNDYCELMLSYVFKIIAYLLFTIFNLFKYFM